MASPYKRGLFLWKIEMAQSEITINLSLKFKWWVKPMMYTAMLWYACHFPIDTLRFAKWLGRRGTVLKVI